MDLKVYIESLENTAKNLPGVLQDWNKIDEDLRSHYCDELLRLLVEWEEACGQAHREGWGVRFGLQGVRFSNVVFDHHDAVSLKMGFSPSLIEGAPLVSQTETKAPVAPGDVVMLKAGGPLMTIDSQESGADRVHCVWFEGADLHRGVFAIKSLKRQIPPPPDDPNSMS